MVPLKLSIDPSFFSQEERCGFVVTPERKRIWAVELDLLKQFAVACEENGLKWFVHAGTMLGAVRHQGFIPWDDDIDVVMPREDYDRLCQLAPTVFSEPYFYQCEETDPFFARTFSRLRNSGTTALLDNERPFRYPFNQGIFLDIFPMDHVPADPEDRKRYYQDIALLGAKAVQWRTMIHFYRPKTGKGLVKRVNYWLKHLYFKYVFKGGYRYFLDKHYDRITQYDGGETGWVGESIISPLGRHLWRSEWFNETVLLPFEMLEVPVPAGYEECLSASFGPDWRTPKNIPAMHWDVLFDTDKPYTEYLKQP